jgi:hypothetical protein
MWWLTVAHLEYRSSRRAALIRKLARSQGMGAEIDGAEPQARGAGLDEIANTLISPACGAKPAPLGDGAEQRTFEDPKSL